MRNNQPITQLETLLPEGQFIYSRTDLHGNIVEANEAFAQISGYRREEMIGQPHNMVRHPDMPEQAFQDMWRDLKQGRPWRGLVKNRRQDGGFYWVLANASPVRENGQIVGYQSVRSCPSREAVQAAAAMYQRIKQGDKSIAVVHGQVVPVCKPLWARFVGLGNQSWLFGGFMLLVSLSLLASSLLPTEGLRTLWQGMGALGLVWSLVFLLLFVPRLRADLTSLDGYLESLLTSGNLKQRFALSRRDELGRVASKLDRFISSVQATVQGMADSATQVQLISREVGLGVGGLATRPGCKAMPPARLRRVLSKSPCRLAR